MLGFPLPYDNELLYSTIARAGVHDGEISPKQLLDTVFEDRKVVATVDLPCHIQQIASQYPESLGLTATNLIKNHTLWPIFAPFVPDVRRVAINKWMKGESRGAAHLASGIAASRIKSKSKLCMCPTCVNEQKEINGEAFWDRRWQVPLVKYCPDHGPLMETDFLLHDEHRHAFYPILRVHKFHNINVTESDILFSSLAYQLFDKAIHRYPTYNQWTSFYRYLATTQGYTKGNRIDHSEIQHQYILHWRRDWLSAANLLPINNESSWLKGIFRKHRKSFSFAEHLTVIEAISQGKFQVKSAIKKALSYPKNLVLEPKIQKRSAGPLNQDQKHWVLLLKANTPKSARRLQPALYARLYRQYKDWLIQTNVAHHIKVPIVNTRVNWQERDRELSVILLKTCQKLEGDLSAPRQSTNRLIKSLPNSATIEKNLYRLPRCQAILIRYSEGIDEYQARRIARAWISIQKRDKKVKRWVLLREAGLSEERMTDITRRLLYELFKNKAGG